MGRSVISGRGYKTTGDAHGSSPQFLVEAIVFCRPSPRKRNTGHDLTRRGSARTHSPVHAVRPVAGAVLPGSSAAALSISSQGYPPGGKPLKQLVQWERHWNAAVGANSERQRRGVSQDERAPRHVWWRA